jgi:RHS repeat-associated protein
MIKRRLCRSLLVVAASAALACSSDTRSGSGRAPLAKPSSGGGGQVPTDPIDPGELLFDEPSSGRGLWTGSFDVDPNGNATYSVPIALPPGRRGMQPPLSLTYSSARGQSYLGVGWSLAGLDEITRCGGTVAQDGATRPVKRDNLDHFCFRGERLVEVTATSTHGGIEFRTERDSFHKVVGYANQHPRTAAAWDITRFEVWAPDGTIRRYGWNEGSRKRDGAGHQLAWMLETVRDRFGNFWSVGYDKPLANGWDRVLGEDTEVVPINLYYTGNDAVSPRLPTKTQVVLDYDLHPSPLRGYHHGVGFGVSRRLRSIKSLHDGGLVEEVRLGYTTSALSGRSLLTSLTRCDRQAVCMTPIRFDYTAGSTDYAGPTDVTDSIFFPTGLPDGDNDQPRVWLHDVTGDDRADLVVLRPTGDHNAVFVAASNGAGFDAPLQSSVLFPQNEEGRFFVEFSDSSHDGVDDLLYWYHTPAGSNPADWILARSSGGVFEVQSEHFASGGAVRFTDLNGDGRTDLLRCELATSSDYHFSFTLDGATASPGAPLPAYTCLIRSGSWSAPNRHLVDLNRDGATEVLFVAGDGRVIALDFTTNAPVATEIAIDASALTPAHPSDPQRIWQFADLNGDGMRDLVVQTLATDGTVLSSRAHPIIGGRFWGGLQGQPFPAVNLKGARVADVNQDGREDFIDLDNAAQPTIYLSRDITGFQATLTGSGLPSLGSDESAVWGDVDGNGVADAVVFDSDTDSGTAELYVNGGTRADLLRAVREGHATVEAVSVEYATLTDPAVYWYDSYGCDAAPPAVCRRGMATAVVGAFERNAGTNLPRRRFELGYENARVDLAGRGWLGFDQVAVHDVATRTTVTTRYDLGEYDAASGRYPLAGVPVEVERRTYVSGAENALLDLHLSRATYDHFVIRQGNSFISYPRTTRVRSWALNDVYEDQLPAIKPVSDSTTTVLEIDSYGNARHVFSSSPDEHTLELTREYENEAATWSIKKPTSETLVSTVPDRAPRTRVTEWTWNHTTAALEEERLRPGAAPGGAPEQVIDLERDAYGNVDEVTVTDVDGNARTTITEFNDPQHIFPTLEINPLGHETERTFHAYNGGMRRSIDPNGEVSRVAFDGFGRVVRLVGADGTQATIRFEAPFNPTAAYRRVVALPGQPEAHSEIDLLGRRTNDVTVGFDGQAVKSGVAYDALGNVAISWQPMILAAEENHAWSYRHDELGRLAEVIAPSGAVWTYRYGLGSGATSSAPLHGLSMTRINPNGESNTRYVDGHGQVERVVDELGEETLYRRGAFGVLEEIEDALGHVIRMTSDDYGFQSELVDPDLGTRTYRYTGFGELELETDTDGATIEHVYDELGRLRQRISSSGETSEWIYDQGSHGLGRLSSAVGPDGHSTAHEYDASGRRWASALTVAGVEHRLELGFDASGRVETITYPDAADGSSFAVRYEFQNGRIVAVRDNTSDLVFWRRVATDWSGRTTRDRYGNGVESVYQYTPDGLPASTTATHGGNSLFATSYYHDYHSNLIGRVDHLQRMTERFAYDRMDRLVRAWFVAGEEPVEPPPPPDPDQHENTQYMAPVDIDINLPPSPPADDPSENDGVTLIDAMAMDPVLLEAARAVSVFGPVPHPGDQRTYRSQIELAYDAVGNIMRRSDIGTYAYAAPLPGGGTRAHAVSRITPLPGGQFTQPRSFVYDSSGRQLSDGLRTYTYTSFDKPRTITDGQGVTRFEYDADGMRVLKEAPRSKTTYTGGLHMRRRAVAGPTAVFPEQTVDHYFVHVDGKVVAEVQRNDTPFAVPASAAAGMEASNPDFDLSQTANTRSTIYYHADYVGSPELLTDSAGLVLERRSYNPFGQLRSPDWATGNAPLAPGARQVGYTGHEDDQELGLVNMKGRLYEPAIGRFTTPDPLVQNPGASQSLNRYAYVFNNPLKFTDPSGFAAGPEHIQMDEQVITAQRPRAPITPAAEPAVAPATVEVGAPLAPHSILSPDEGFGAGMAVSMIPIVGSYLEAKSNEQAAIEAKNLYVQGYIGYGDFAAIQALALFSAMMAALDVLQLGLGSVESRAGLLAVNGGADALIHRMSETLRNLIRTYQQRYTKTIRGDLLRHLAGEVGLDTAQELTAQYQVYFHGTARQGIESWTISPTKPLFTSHDIAVARAFAEVEAGARNLPCTEVAGVAILVPLSKVPLLKANGMRTTPLLELPGTESVFPDGTMLDKVADAVVVIPLELWQLAAGPGPAQ